MESTPKTISNLNKSIILELNILIKNRLIEIAYSSKKYNDPLYLLFILYKL